MDTLDSRASKYPRLTKSEQAWNSANRAVRRAPSPTASCYSLPYMAAIAAGRSLLYSNTFSEWYYEWTTPGSFYAHATFVPFFVAVMLWRNRETPATCALAALVDGTGSRLCRVASCCCSPSIRIYQPCSRCRLCFCWSGRACCFGTAKTRLLLFPAVVRNDDDAAHSRPVDQWNRVSYSVEVGADWPSGC